MTAPGDIIWQPDHTRIEGAEVSAFIRWLRYERGLDFADYQALWAWSVADLEAFWLAVWDYFDIDAKGRPATLLSDRAMPGAVWAKGAELNFAAHMLRHWDNDRTAIHEAREDGSLRAISGRELRAQVASFAAFLASAGVETGDCVAAILPNISEAPVAMLSAASLGATWVACAPDFGSDAILDRLSQVHPKILLAVDHYVYGGKLFDKRDAIAAIAAALPSLTHLVQVERDGSRPIASVHAERLTFADALARHPGAPLAFKPLPFDHPLWVLFTSGTTGLPKAIVHGHGGITLEFHKTLGFHCDLGDRSRILLLSSTGWVVWNLLVGCLIRGTAIVLYDGSPGYPDMGVIWKLIERTGVTYFGASPTYIAQCQIDGVEPARIADLSALTGLLLSGSPVTAEQMAWCHAEIKQDIWIGSQSGGTEIASGFVGAVPTLPVRAGEIQVRCLGVDVVSVDGEGQEQVGAVGELVVRQPMPSMPLRFLNDPDDARFREAYFSDFPGWWRHGDFFEVLDTGGCRILGRSDAVLNRNGVRIGSSEIYRALEPISAIADSLIVNIELPDGGFHMPLFVALAPDARLDAALVQEVRATLKARCSPRHVPDTIVAVPLIPYTITGKKLEVPVRNLLAGKPLAKAANLGVVRDAAAFDAFVDYARDVMAPMWSATDG